jgi:hypothetical protein
VRVRGGGGSNVRCAGITKGGTRCRLDATHGSYCYQHSPETVEARKRNASRGGKAGGNGRTSGLSEIAEAKRWTKGLVTKLLAGDVPRDIATAAFMGLNTLARYIEVERKHRELEEVVERLEQIEDAIEAQKEGGGTWGIGTG